MTITTLSVPAISCATCKTAIETAVATQVGVSAVEVDVAARTVTIRHDQRASADALVGLIEDQGYDVAGHRAER